MHTKQNQRKHPTTQHITVITLFIELERGTSSKKQALSVVTEVTEVTETAVSQHRSFNNQYQSTGSSVFRPLFWTSFDRCFVSDVCDAKTSDGCEWFNRNPLSYM
ncbi:hypothetical protein RRG08_027538 [Elysia crispata]|uniref:Uncharacterized protein n=1 Tax=Elysia crispata TaxID=231223 RepID=A0AAE1BCG2_9GAST|nr:hypothetical protein RRG08_027538 [Elysia crispata]